MLYAMFIMTLMFLFLNLSITKKDYFHPTNIIMILFTLYQFFLVLGSDYYKVDIISETFYVFAIFYVVVTLLTLLSKSLFPNKYTFFTEKLEYVRIPTSIIYIFIFVQLMFIYQQYQLTSEVVSYVYGGAESISDTIEKFQHYTKFLSPYVDLRIENYYLLVRWAALIVALTYYLIYVGINNYFVTGRIPLWNVIVIFNFTLYLLTSGSRSPIFRLVTFILFIYIYLKIKTNPNFKINAKFVMQAIFYSIILVVFSFLSLSLMGRAFDTEEISILSYIFIYTAAPIQNLNMYLRDNYDSFGDRLFGEQTLAGIYNYIYSVTGDEDYKVLSLTEILPFNVSDNNLELGNVYTTFYMFIYDHGLTGVLMFSTIIFIYYIFSYSGIVSRRTTSTLSLQVFLYAYLINDLIMLPFSNRFFESVAIAYFAKFLVSAWIIGIIVKKINSPKHVNNKGNVAYEIDKI